MYSWLLVSNQYSGSLWSVLSVVLTVPGISAALLWLTEWSWRPLVATLGTCTHTTRTPSHAHRPRISAPPPSCCTGTGTGLSGGLVNCWWIREKQHWITRLTWAFTTFGKTLYIWGVGGEREGGGAAEGRTWSGQGAGFIQGRAGFKKRKKVSCFQMAGKKEAERHSDDAVC